MNSALRENQYVSAPGFITAERAAALAQEFRDLEREGRYSNDSQAPNSPATYNFLPFVRLLVEKVAYVSDLCGEPVLPTYAYGRIYKHGAVLKRHKDRDACEISFTLNLAKDVDWPIFIQDPAGRDIALELNPGDAMMYLGCEAEHWREPYVGTSHIQVFLHYVLAYGPRAYTFFNIARNRPDAGTVPAESGNRLATPLGPPPLTGAGNNIKAPFVRPSYKVGRNDACPCGSGKKYKHCHG